MLPFFPFQTEYAGDFLPKIKNVRSEKSDHTVAEIQENLYRTLYINLISGLNYQTLSSNRFQSMTFRAVPAISKSERSSVGKQQIALSGIKHENTSSFGSCCDSNTGRNQCQSPKCKFIYFYSKPIRAATLSEQFFMNVDCHLLYRSKKNYVLRQIPLARSPFPGYSLNRLFVEEDLRCLLQV